MGSLPRSVKLGDGKGKAGRAPATVRGHEGTHARPPSAVVRSRIPATPGLWIQWVIVDVPGPFLGIASMSDTLQAMLDFP